MLYREALFPFRLRISNDKLRVFALHWDGVLNLKLQQSSREIIELGISRWKAWSSRKQMSTQLSKKIKGFNNLILKTGSCNVFYRLPFVSRIWRVHSLFSDVISDPGSHRGVEFNLRKFRLNKVWITFAYEFKFISVDTNIARNLITIFSDIVGEVTTRSIVRISNYSSLL